MQKAIAEEIESVLIPKIIQAGQLSVKGALSIEDVKIRSVTANSLTVTGFALTAPFKVHVELYTSSNPNNIKSYDLVVKVSNQNYCAWCIDLFFDWKLI